MTDLDHGDYDATAHTLLIRRGKGGKSRLLPVGERAAVWLDRYLSESRPHFAHLPSETAMFLSGYGTRITPAYLGNWVAGQMKLAGITTKGSCHLFSHSCATSMHIGGADIRYVQEILGHARMETTQIYTHVHIAALAEVHARCHPHGRIPSSECVPNSESQAGSSEPSEESSPWTDSPSHPLPDSLGKNIEMLEVCPSKLSALATPSNRLGNYSDDDLDPPSFPFPTQPVPTPPPLGNPAKTITPNQSDELSTSTKHGHLNCYGYRYYGPTVGRWSSRDPIGESGGENLYGMISNNPANNFEILGLRPGDGISGILPVPPEYPEIPYPAPAPIIPIPNPDVDIPSGLPGGISDQDYIQEWECNCTYTACCQGTGSCNLLVVIGKGKFVDADRSVALTKADAKSIENADSQCKENSSSCNVRKPALDRALDCECGPAPFPLPVFPKPKQPGPGINYPPIQVD
ncbi:hypothetical protein NT6N_04440 [Oceaniferula spumae]|uniref:Tyr recombinase domain-containing protein n=1 Tax=Oceaniferula spumae TaxID=2979115 RepID=A0AAT9FHB5_9BACT